MAKSKNGNDTSERKGLSAAELAKLLPKGFKLGESKRKGGGGAPFIVVGGEDGDEAFPFKFERVIEIKGTPRAEVTRLDTGEAGVLPSWGFIRVALEGAKKGDLFMLNYQGMKKMTAGQWKGKSAHIGDVIPIVKGR